VDRNWKSEVGLALGAAVATFFLAMMVGHLPYAISFPAFLAAVAYIFVIQPEIRKNLEPFVKEWISATVVFLLLLALAIHAIEKSIDDHSFFYFELRPSNGGKEIWAVNKANFAFTNASADILDLKSKNSIVVRKQIGTIETYGGWWPDSGLPQVSGETQLKLFSREGRFVEILRVSQDKQSIELRRMDDGKLLFNTSR
jgi:hypothetical protein